MKVRVNDRVEITVERRPQLADRPLPVADVPDFLNLADYGPGPTTVPERLADLAPFELLPDGLPDYY